MYLFILFLSYLISLASAASEIVVTNHPKCTIMAKNYIQNFNVTPPELAIIISVCEGVVNPQDSGLGGGFQATVFNGYCGETLYINSRERSPGRFVEKSKKRHLNIGVPSMLKGYEYLYKMNMCGVRSKLPWKKLFTASIELAETGWATTNTTMLVMGVLDGIDHNIEMRDRKKYMRNPKLAQTLRKIAEEGPSSSLYQKNGFLHQKAMKDLQAVNNIIKSSDFLKYNVEAKPPFSSHYFFKYQIATTRIPGSGAVIIFGMKIIQSVYDDLTKLSRDQRMLFMYHTLRYMYSLKPYLRSKKVDRNEIFANAEVIGRSIISKLNKPWPPKPITKFGNYKIKGDLLRQSEQFGTSNIVIKRGKYAITMTSTINWGFGSKLYSRRLGIFYNNQLNDFDDVGTPNGPAPFKVPQSAICATVLYTKNDNPVFQVGAAGGSKIIGAVFNVVFNYFVNNMTLEKAVKAPRCIPKYKDLHEVVLLESDIRKSVSKIFKDFGSEVEPNEERGYAAVTASSTIRGEPEASYDDRRGGKVHISKKSSYR